MLLRSLSPKVLQRCPSRLPLAPRHALAAARMLTQAAAERSPPPVRTPNPVRLLCSQRRLSKLHLYLLQSVPCLPLLHRSCAQRHHCFATAAAAAPVTGRTLQLGWLTAHSFAHLQLNLEAENQSSTSTNKHPAGLVPYSTRNRSATPPSLGYPNCHTFLCRHTTCWLHPVLLTSTR